MLKPYCSIPCHPIRAANSDKSEMVSQLLYGETFDIIQEVGNWAKIHAFDDYIGWIDSRVVSKKSVDERQKCYVNKLWVELVSDRQEMTVSYGAELNADSDEFDIHSFCFSEKKTVEQIINDVKMFKNTPYLWGGRSSFGLDCSGLIQIVAKVNGYSLPRDASKQAFCGSTVEFQNRKVGDLAFFESDTGKISHVGILNNRDEIWHASAWVRLDAFDEKGIFDSEKKQYSHNLFQIRSVFEE